ncbi:MAG: ATP:cob(I)alamin adenosyltransferase [Acidobacteria bacterium]|nr:ATP:cob(I)alamin adenosyltransferase [Acidobacteriota bacterium]MDP7338088.1 cob(I)yrinic acid a,c-diamide adenosyltransferase [Vicinamibacterales bacterium]MDP7478836.1 cob(I)yrinic acid a,c-diamide adenosyltransferase [Vicinamibacterales bacterium]HJN44426.1 cob(I)yrinic acid a,c-diamide adenosyltransferase [Vicinamibacterales bacterium]
MKIYTRRGDTGETGLRGGRRVSKAEPRVDAYGEVDELNACLGLVLCTAVDPDLVEMVVQIQHQLFSLGASLADPTSSAAARAKESIGQADVERLEGWIDRLEAELAPLRRFILPGGHPAAAAAQLARAVCRRAERRMVAVGAEAVGAVALAYVNRLSDLLFTLARAVNVRAGVREQEW